MAEIYIKFHHNFDLINDEKEETDGDEEQKIRKIVTIKRETNEYIVSARAGRHERKLCHVCKSHGACITPM